MATKHHVKRIRGIHTRYALVMANMALAGFLLAYGLVARANHELAVADGTALHALMDGAGADVVLAPPVVLEGR